MKKIYIYLSVIIINIINKSFPKKIMLKKYEYNKNKYKIQICIAS